MAVRDWMSPDPVTIGPSETIREALQRLRRNRFEHLPVTLGGAVLGMLCGGTLLGTFLSGDGNAEALMEGRVADYMIEVPLLSPDMSEAEALARMRSCQCTTLPVVDGQRLVGILSQEDLFGHLLERLGGGSPRRQPRSSASRLDVLLGIAREVASTLELPVILREITRQLMTVLPVDRSALLLLRSPDDQEMEVHSLVTGSDEEGQPRTIPREGTVSGWVALHRTSLRIDDLAAEQQRFPVTARMWKDKMRSMLSAPLVYRGEVLGVLNFWCRRPYAYLESDRELLELVAGHVAAAVHNIGRFEREQKLVEELREANRIKDEFLAVVTHDLRNALQALMAYSRILMRRAARLPEIASLAEGIHEAADYMAGLTADLHDLARLGMKAIRLHPQEVDLQELVPKVLEDYAEMAREAGIELRARGGGPGRLRADPLRLRQILANLVSNAIKYNRPQG
ncbi:MAG TPA: CBS domain-containing protein, partial [Candidatus Nitrosotenuis sp.]|nr:CBS domain-containing protein [Candidatus Nitrosotenuis sp.]